VRSSRYLPLSLIPLLSMLTLGCSSWDGSPAKSEGPVTGTSPGTSTPSPPTAPTSATGPTAALPVPEVSVIHDGIVTDPGIQIVEIASPSQNILCAMDESGVRCDIRERDWVDPPTPADCLQDYGSSVIIDEYGPGHIGCVGDVIVFTDHVLSYGEGVVYLGFECRSSRQGMYCRSLSTGHGFMLAREGYVLF
jgi:hypothetical protein